MKSVSNHLSHKGRGEGLVLPSTGRGYTASPFASLVLLTFLLFFLFLSDVCSSGVVLTEVAVSADGAAVVPWPPVVVEAAVSIVVTDVAGAVPFESDVVDVVAEVTGICI